MQRLTPPVLDLDALVQVEIRAAELAAMDLDGYDYFMNEIEADGWECHEWDGSYNPTGNRRTEISWWAGYLAREIAMNR